MPASRPKKNSESSWRSSRELSSARSRGCRSTGNKMPCGELTLTLIRMRLRDYPNSLAGCLEIGRAGGDMDRPEVARGMHLADRKPIPTITLAARPTNAADLETDSGRTKSVG